MPQQGRLPVHPRHLVLRPEFQDRATTHSLPHRAWAFHAHRHVLATTHSLQVRVQVAPVAHVRLAQVALLAPVALVVRLVPVALVVLVAQVGLVAQQVQDSAHHVLALAAALLLPAASVPRAQVALRAVALVVAAAVSVAEPQVHSERAGLAVRQRLASQSVQSAKNTSRDKHQALVAQLCHVATATRCFVCAAVPAFKTLPTRSMPTPVS